MLGTTNAYESYFDDDDDDELDFEEYCRKKRRRKIIIITIIIALIVFFIVFSIVSVFMKNPYVVYDLTERNDFGQDFSNPEVIKEYFPN